MSMRPPLHFQRRQLYPKPDYKREISYSIFDQLSDDDDNQNEETYEMKMECPN